jgi:hypothetical protein
MERAVFCRGVEAVFKVKRIRNTGVMEEDKGNNSKSREDLSCCRFFLFQPVIRYRRKQIQIKKRNLFVKA